MGAAVSVKPQPVLSPRSREKITRSREFRKWFDWKEPEEDEENIIAALNTRALVKVRAESIQNIDSLFSVLQKINVPVELSIVNPMTISID